MPNLKWKRTFLFTIVTFGLLYVMFQYPDVKQYQHQGESFFLQKYHGFVKKRNTSNLPLMILFTTSSSLAENSQIYSNTLKTWASMKPFIQPVIFTNITEMSVFANAAGWYTLPLPGCTCDGVPILREMFQTIFKFTHTDLAAYANSDILFNPGLIDSLIGLKDFLDRNNVPILMTGKRIDVFIDKIKDNIVANVAEVDKLLGEGVLSWDYAADYFVTNRKFPWSKVPDLVVGRALYDNWIIDFSRKKNVKVIDSTNTVNALHQTTKSNKPRTGNSMCNKELLIKLRLLPQYPIKFGQISCASHQTAFSFKNNVQILPKKFLTYECGQRDSPPGVPLALT